MNDRLPDQDNGETSQGFDSAHDYGLASGKDSGKLAPTNCAEDTSYTKEADRSTKALLGELLEKKKNHLIEAKANKANGLSNRVGRTAGQPNKLTSTVRESFESTFKEMQRNANNRSSLKRWAEANPTEFYRLAARLIPADLNVSASVGFQVLIKPEERDL